MNFFAAQDHARKATRWLVLVYIAATLLIVAGVTLIVGFGLFGSSADGARYSLGQMLTVNSGPLLATAVTTTLFIVGASLYKTAVLSAGGGRVAQDLGGTAVAADVSDPLRRRLRNVVEEMAIASGVPVPEIYVLEEENGINAFAAGFSPGDAAIAVTRGTLELLNRDELQGVIAHEFSHILNGDMRLNIRLMGVLFGILVLGLMGRMIMRGGYHAQLFSGRRNRGTPVVLFIGLGLAILGGIGVLIARIIKAGISRQREYLADASAVQFTRQRDGIANALKKIGGYTEASYLRVADPEEISHMLFGSGARFSGLFATHPPLTKRIRAIDPSFRETDYPVVDADATRRAVAERGSSETRSAFAGSAQPPAGSAVALADAVVGSAGQPQPEHVAFAEQLRRSIPATLYDAAHSVELALLLTVALSIDRSGQSTGRQLEIVQEQLGSDRTRLVRQYVDELSRTSPGMRLPLLEIAFPALKRRPGPQLQFLVQLLGRLIDLDGKVDLYEFCFYRVLRNSLGQAVDPSAGVRRQRVPRGDLRQAALDLITVIADYGHNDERERRRAFDAGRARFGKWAEKHIYESKQQESLPALDSALDRLGALNGKGKQALLQAVSDVAAHDGRVTIAEAELIRTICVALDCPVPPLLTGGAAP